jgi:Leucine-rich repeat (LRR) protein
MGLSPSLFASMRFLLSLLLFYLILFSASFSFVQPVCHDDESFALMKFKESFTINRSASGDPSAYPKVSLWKPESGDCCRWRGVKCNEDTGHVISIDLSSSCLYGSINSSSSLFQLVHLQSLNLADNDFNFSHIPTAFRQLSRLTNLDLSYSVFSGQITSEIFELSNLVSLDLSGNSLKLQKPGLKSLAQKLTNLKELDLSGVDISSTVPNILANLSSLTSLYLRECNFSGPIPSSLGNLTQLISLNLADNGLHGSIPQSISRLVNLENLALFYNHLSGTVEFDLFLKLKNLTWLQLSYNNISLLTKPSTNATLPKFEILTLDSCDLSEFPEFLRNQDELGLLSLSDNKIHGQIPKWMWNLSRETLWDLDLGFNSLTGFDQLPAFLPWTNLRVLKLDSNNLQGSLPIPPPSINWYSVSNNTLTGEIPQLICNLSSALVLDLSSNYLNGLLPKCLGNMSEYLSILNLHGNSFHGTIPDTFPEGNKLKMIDFRQNQLQGRLPRSLANCTMLEALNLGHNQVNDTFPFWLGILPELRVLILRSNGIYGAMGNPNSSFDFPNIRIIDLSNNEITGKLPSQYFQTWKAMRIVDVKGLMYMQANESFTTAGTTWGGSFPYTMTFTYKGAEREYKKILDFFIAIDLSCNKFEGEIPEVVGHLKGLQLLNLSNNFLTGPIPSSLVNLSGLEVLDFAQNKLSGVIPMQLVQLTFLEFFNVSHNHLKGPIPQGNQFNTFPNSSFSDNPELCGNPLSKKCGNSEDSPPLPSTFEQNQKSSSSFEFTWKEVVMGYGCGFIVGLLVGQIVIKHDWVMRTFAIGQATRRMVNLRGKRN